MFALSQRWRWIGVLALVFVVGCSDESDDPFVSLGNGSEEELNSITTLDGISQAGQGDGSAGSGGTTASTDAAAGEEDSLNEEQDVSQEADATEETQDITGPLPEDSNDSQNEEDGSSDSETNPEDSSNEEDGSEADINEGGEGSETASEEGGESSEEEGGETPEGGESNEEGGEATEEGGSEECESDCDDGNPCTDSVCVNGECIHQPLVGVSCDDGNACSAGDVCLATGGCLGTIPVVCDDGNACTLDKCEADIGCTAIPDDSKCDDGIACTVDVCDSNSGCQHTPNNTVCVSSALCLEALCDPTEGCIETELDNCCGNGQQEENEECDDGNVLNGDGCNDICSIELSCPDSCVMENVATVLTSKVQKINATEPLKNSLFGYSIAQDENWLVIGSPGPDIISVFELKSETWELFENVGIETNSFSSFGYSVDVYDGTIAVGDRTKDDQTGAVYIFDFDSAWALSQELVASDGYSVNPFSGTGPQFGFIVSIDGNTLAVSAQGDDGKKGAVYIFERNQNVWEETQKLTASDGAAADWFGIALDLHGDVLVVSASYDDDLGEQSGSAYVFNRIDGQWVQTQKLVANDGDAEEYFGESVVVSDEFVFIGGRTNSSAGNKSGAVYVFAEVDEDWIEVQKIEPKKPEAQGLFGHSIGYANGFLAVGAPGANPKGTFSGTSYLYEFSNGMWGDEIELAAFDGLAQDYFGSTISLYEDRLVIGAYSGNAGPNSPDVGAAYAYTIPEQCSADNTCVCAPGYTGADCGISLPCGAGGTFASASFALFEKPGEESTITLEDSDGTKVTFELDNENDGVALGHVALDLIALFGGGGIGTIGNLVYAIENHEDLNISAEQPVATEILLSQETVGTKGNTPIVLTNSGGEQWHWQNVALSPIPDSFDGGIDGSAPCGDGTGEEGDLCEQSMDCEPGLICLINESTAASATFTFGLTEFDDVNGASIQLTATDGTTVKYTLKNDYSAVSPEFNAGAIPEVAAENLIIEINGENGHLGKIKATRQGAKVFLEQAQSGSAGNTSIVLENGFEQTTSIAPPSSFQDGMDGSGVCSGD